MVENVSDMLKSMTIEFSQVWEVYMADGSVATFLRGIADIYNRALPLKKETNGKIDYVKFVEFALNEYTKRNTDIDSHLNILVGCVKAVKGVIPCGQSRPSVGGLIAGATKIGRRMLKLESAESRDIAKEAMLLLLSRDPLPELVDSSSRKTAPPEIAGREQPTAEDSDEGDDGDEQDRAQEEEEEKKGEPVVKRRKADAALKLTLKLTFRLLDTFLITKTVWIPPEHLERFLFQITDSLNWSCSVSLMSHYRYVFSSRIAEILCHRLLEANEWEQVSVLISIIAQEMRKNHLRLCREGKRTEIDLTLPPLGFDRLPNTGETLSELDYRLPSADPPPRTRKMGIAETPVARLVWVVERLLLKAVETNSIPALRAAADVASALGYTRTHRQLKQRMLESKLLQFVRKGKWALGVQAAKSDETRVFLYETLKKRGMFMEATEAYHQLGLQGQVSPVKPEELEEQRRVNAQRYLQFPPTSQVKLTVVDSLETLTYAALVLGLSLHSHPVPMTPEGTAGRPQQSQVSETGPNESELVSSFAPLQHMFARYLYSNREGIDRLELSSSQHGAIASDLGASSAQPTRAASSGSLSNSEFGPSSVSGLTDRASNSTSEVPVLKATGAHPPAPDPTNETGAKASGLKGFSGAPFRAVVGLDSEWKVVMYERDKDRKGSSILQVACQDHVFVLDFAALSVSRDPNPPAAAHTRSPKETHSRDRNSRNHSDNRRESNINSNNNNSDSMRNSDFNRKANNNANNQPGERGRSEAPQEPRKSGGGSRHERVPAQQAETAGVNSNNVNSMNLFQAGTAGIQQQAYQQQPIPVYQYQQQFPPQYYDPLTGMPMNGGGMSIVVPMDQQQFQQHYPQQSLYPYPSPMQKYPYTTSAPMSKVPSEASFLSSQYSYNSMQSMQSMQSLQSAYDSPYMSEVSVQMEVPPPVYSSHPMMLELVQQPDVDLDEAYGCYGYYDSSSLSSSLSSSPSVQLYQSPGLPLDYVPMPPSAYQQQNMPMFPMTQPMMTPSQMMTQPLHVQRPSASKAAKAKNKGKSSNHSKNSIAPTLPDQPTIAPTLGAPSSNQSKQIRVSGLNVPPPPSILSVMSAASASAQGDQDPHKPECAAEVPVAPGVSAPDEATEQDAVGEKQDLTEVTKAFLYSLFSDEKVLKVGWAFGAEDLKMLRRSADGRFREVFGDIKSFLDLDQVVSDEQFRFGIKSKNDTEITAQTGTPEPPMKSLSSACERYLGKPLLKTQQLSDWDLRPLSTSQLEYAGLDAHSLLGILDVMLQEQNFLLAVAAQQSEQLKAFDAIRTAQDENSIAFRCYGARPHVEDVLKRLAEEGIPEPKPAETTASEASEPTMTPEQGVDRSASMVDAPQAGRAGEESGGGRRRSRRRRNGR